MPPLSVSAIVIMFDSGRYLRSCLEALRNQSVPPEEIIVIDNHSSDGSAGLAASLIPEASIVRNPENRGFAAAANQGIALTKGEYVFLLNPDLRLEKDYLAEVIGALEERGETWGSATGKLLRGEGDGIEPTGLVDSKGIRMTRSGRHLDIGSEELDQGNDQPTEVFGVSGAAAVYRRSFLDDSAVAGEIFDESFFAYREDADLSWRGRLLGWSALYVPSAVGYHVRSVTPSVRRRLPPAINMHSVKNRFLLRLKNQGLFLFLRNLPFELFRDLIVVAATLTVERSSLPALGWLWVNRASIFRKRDAIQKRRRVRDRELVRWFR